MAYRFVVLFKVQYNAQVIYLEHMLNAAFNGGAPAYTAGLPTGIYIGPGADDSAPFYVFRKSETETENKWLFNKSETPTDVEFVYLNTVAEGSADNYDYTVMVPIAIGDLTTNPILYNQIFARVMLYNQAGKSFKIFNYTP